MNEIPSLLSSLFQSRQTTLPKRLGLPGPDAEQLLLILDAAGHAPDHGQLLPWRFVVIPDGARSALGRAFSDALLERDSSALPEQLQQAFEKALRAPLLFLLVVEDERGDAEIGLLERVVSAGCAVQNMLLMATALGFGSALTSGKALKSSSLRRLFGLNTHEHAVCFLNMGTVQRGKPARVRPNSDHYVTYLSTESR
jgi:nitroreductase